MPHPVDLISVSDPGKDCVRDVTHESGSASSSSTSSRMVCRTVDSGRRRLGDYGKQRR